MIHYKREVNGCNDNWIEYISTLSNNKLIKLRDVYGSNSGFTDKIALGDIEIIEELLWNRRDKKIDLILNGTN